MLVVYCDGAYLSGSNSTPTVANGTRLHFRGRDILTAVLRELADVRGLRAATDVLLGGCSAGGIATFAHADWVARLLRGGGGDDGGDLDDGGEEDAVDDLGDAAGRRGGGGGGSGGALIRRRARFAAFAISGYYMDVDFFSRQKVFPFEQSNVSAVLDARCLAAQAAAGAPHKCLVADVNAPFLRTPTFAFQSKSVQSSPDDRPARVRCRPHGSRPILEKRERRVLVMASVPSAA